MSQHKNCPFCKRVIRVKDKYCPYCGRYVLESPPPQNIYSRVTQPTPTVPTPPPGTYPSPVPPPGSYPAQMPPQPTPPSPTSTTYPPPSAQQVPPKEEPEELDEETIEQIALRVELEQLDRAMSDIRKKIEDLAEMISKIEVTDEIENKIKTFKNKVKEIKAKREKLNAEKKELPFERDLLKKKEIQERLKNLNEAYRSKKVTESAFKKLRDEYESQLREIDNKSRAFKAKINIWIKKLKSNKTNIQEELELIEARYAAGELTSDAYEKEKHAASEKLKRYNDVIEYLSAKL
ncbi:MAG: hypothetical protein ACTSYB_01805 [Candidatus Helarchaeota archaeon]